MKNEKAGTKRHFLPVIYNPLFVVGAPSTTARRGVNRDTRFRECNAVQLALHRPSGCGATGPQARVSVCLSNSSVFNRGKSMHGSKRFFVLVGVVLACSLGQLAVGAEKIKVLIVTGFDAGAHKWDESSRLNQAILQGSDRFDVSISNDKNVFASPKLADYDVLVLNFGFWMEPDPSNEAKAGLMKYVQEGGNIVALHFACSAFQEWKEFGEMLGRKWVKGVGGHGPYGEFTVNIKDTEHPVTKGLQAFKTEDELYAKLSGDTEIQVLATADSSWSGKTEPIVFARSFGKGRVLQNVLGHGIDAKQNPAYQRLLRRSVEWAATGTVTVD
jgi:type 1 glutamine amidotransferase